MQQSPRLRRLLRPIGLLTRTSTAAKAGENENEPYDVARIATAKARSTAATATIEQHNEQHYVTSIATATVCTV